MATLFITLLVILTRIARVNILTLALIVALIVMVIIVSGTAPEAISIIKTNTESINSIIKGDF